MDHELFDYYVSYDVYEAHTLKCQGQCLTLATFPTSQKQT